MNCFGWLGIILFISGLCSGVIAYIGIMGLLK